MDLKRIKTHVGSILPFTQKWLAKKNNEIVQVYTSSEVEIMLTSTANTHPILGANQPNMRNQEKPVSFDV